MDGFPYSPFDFSSNTPNFDSLSNAIFSPLTQDIHTLISPKTLNSTFKNTSTIQNVVDKNNKNNNVIPLEFEKPPVPQLKEPPSNKFNKKKKQSNSNLTPTNHTPTSTSLRDTKQFLKSTPQLNEPKEKRIKEKNQNLRSWRTIKEKKEILKEDGNVFIQIKSRRESPMKMIPDRLYSSIKYDIIQKFEGEFLKGVPFLLGKIQVVDAIKLEEIRKNNSTVLSGVVESAITPSREGKFEQKMKIQFTDVSYHHNRKKFRLKISYYLNNDLKNPILVKLSPDFMVYARKPNKQNHKKRKRVNSVQQDNNSGGVVKRKRVREFLGENCSDSFLEFTNRFNDLLEQNISKLNSEERKKAMDLVLCKLFKVDNQMLQNQVLLQQQQPQFTFQNCPTRFL